MRPRLVLAFDVNETLLDLSPLDPIFKAAFGSPALRTSWFAQMLQLAFVGTITDRYLDFTAAQRASLEMLATRQGRPEAMNYADELAGAMRRLPAHPDVPRGLARLRDAGFRMTALTNSPRAVAIDQLGNAGILNFLEETISADEVRRLKPAPEPYRLLAERMDVPVDCVMLVAAHAWDVSGALAVGCRAAFIGRSGAVPSPVGLQAELVLSDIEELSQALSLQS